MQNPFTKAQLRNYMLLYGLIVLIMVLFYILSSYFGEEQAVIEKRVFKTDVETPQTTEQKDETPKAHEPRFRVLEKAY